MQRAKNSRFLTVEEDGGSYLASVSDMMAGLLFLFIITLMVFVIHFNRQKIHFEQKTTELTDAKQARTQLLTDLQKSLLEKGVQVRIDTDGGILRMPEDILFPSGSSELQAEGEHSLEILAQTLTEKLPCYTGDKNSVRPAFCEKDWYPGRLDAVFIEGHTDNRPISNKKIYTDNWELSAMRGIVTYKKLLLFHPELGRLVNHNNQPLFSVTGYADSRPVVKWDEPTDEPRNRRIDLRFIVAPPKAD